MTGRGGQGEEPVTGMTRRQLMGTAAVAAVEVTALVMDAIQNTVSRVMAGPSGSSRVPNAPS